MGAQLVNRMNFHGYVVENGVFYEVYGSQIMTVDQAIAWLESLQ